MGGGLSTLPFFCLANSCMSPTSAQLTSPSEKPHGITDALLGSQSLLTSTDPDLLHWTVPVAPGPWGL